MDSATPSCERSRSLCQEGPEFGPLKNQLSDPLVSEVGVVVCDTRGVDALGRVLNGRIGGGPGAIHCCDESGMGGGWKPVVFKSENSAV